MWMNSEPRVPVDKPGFRGDFSLIVSGAVNSFAGNGTERFSLKGKASS